VMDADGCPDTDNDGDGVDDANDACPNEKGAIADRGCPQLDRDRDGVGDSVDACPDAPETMNGYSDEDGCPDTKPTRIEITEEQIVIKQRVNFATGKATILGDSFPVLDDVAQVMRDYPRLKVEIGGHTDNVGDEAVNQRLSKARADAVFEYLLTKGIPANRMMTVGYGEMKPIDTNSTDAGRLANRRVEFRITEQ
jgi:outer membrane protein OmpA-like peptidoglycan-associated protein